MRIMELPQDSAAFFARHELQQDRCIWLRSELELLDAQTGDRDRLAAQYERKHPRVSRLLLKTVVSPMGYEGITPDETAVSREFDEGIQPISMLVSIAAERGWRPMARNKRMVMRASDLTGAAVGPGEPKPISSLTLTGAFGTPRKSICQVVVTNELIEVGKSEAFINAGLKAGEFNANNAAVIQAIRDSTSLAVSSTVEQILSDGFGALTYSDANSRFYIAVASDVSRRLAGLAGTGGLFYPAWDAGAGGVLGKVRGFVVDSLAAGEAFFDASAFGGDSGVVRFSFAKHASVQMNDSPTNAADTPTTLTNLWQTNSRAILCERHYVFENLRPDAAVVMSGLDASI